MELGRLGLVACLVGFFIAYWVATAIYSVTFHKLAKIPGPWWAAVSYLPEFYYDVIQGGLYFKKIVEMHHQYGPLVRVNPGELHLNDPYFYEKKTERDKYNVRRAGTTVAINSTLDHDLHYRRRGYVSHLFSKKAITSMEPNIQTKVDRVVSALKDARHKGETIVGLQLFAALTTDVISHLAYGESFGELEKPGFPCFIQRDMKTLLLSAHIREFLPLVTGAIQLLPNALLRRPTPAVSSFLDLKDMLKGRAIAAVKNKGLERKPGKPGKPTTLLDALTDDSKVPQHEQTVERLKDDCELVLLTGVDTTARTLTSILCLIVTYPTILAKLRNELFAATAKPKPPYADLLNPTQTAFISEALRWQTFTTGRFLRVPVAPLPYKDLVIPGGTPIGAMPWLLNRHPDIFPDPDTFRPERWLEAAARGEHLDRYLVTFTKGSRMCLGMNLAYVELYLMTAGLVLGFEFELVNGTAIGDVIPYLDFVLAFNREYGFGVDFVVKRVLSE